MKRTLLTLTLVLCACGHSPDGGDSVDGNLGSGDLGSDGSPSPGADAAAAPTGTGMWQGHGAGTAAASVTAMASDTDGAVIAVGLFEGSLDFGPGYMASRGGTDIFVVKYAADGTLQWSRQLGGCGNEQQPTVAIGPDHAVYVAGLFQFEGSLSCDPFFANARVPTTFADFGIGLPLVVSRFEANGDETWAKGYGPGTGNIGNLAIAVHGDLVALAFTPLSPVAMDLGNGVSFNSDSATDIAAVSTTDGTARWGEPLGAQHSIVVAGMAIDDDQLVIAGGFYSVIDVGAPQPIVGFGESDAILVAYDLGDGGYRWHRQLGGPGDDQVGGISRAPDGTFWISGSFTKTAHFGGAALTSTDEGYCGYAAHFTADGDPLASFETLATARNFNAGNAAFADGVLVAASVEPHDQSRSALLMRFDGQGTTLWTDALAGSISSAQAVVTGPHAEIVVGGEFTNMLTVPGLAPVQRLLSSNHGYADAFIVRVAP